MYEIRFDKFWKVFRDGKLVRFFNTKVGAENYIAGSVLKGKVW